MNLEEYIPFDPDQIGKRIRFSGEHVVYKYGEDRVIKFPFGPIYKADPAEALEKASNEFRFVKKYLGDFIVPSSLFIYQERGVKKYCIVQDFIFDKPLRLKEVLEDKVLKERLRELIGANDFMYENTRYTLEFFGIRGLIFHGISRRMENVVTTKNKELKIIDFGLISDLNLVSRSSILRGVIAWAIKRQKKLLEKYLR